MHKRDDLLKLAEFGEAVTAAMNEAGVRVPEDAEMAAVMTVVVPDQNAPVPVGGSINWSKERERWELMHEAQYSEPVHDI